MCCHYVSSTTNSSHLSLCLKPHRSFIYSILDAWQELELMLANVDIGWFTFVFWIKIDLLKKQCINVRVVTMQLEENIMKWKRTQNYAFTLSENMSGLVGEYIPFCCGKDRKMRNVGDRNVWRYRSFRVWASERSEYVKHALRTVDVCCQMWGSNVTYAVACVYLNPTICRIVDVECWYSIFVRLKTVVFFDLVVSCILYMRMLSVNL